MSDEMREIIEDFIIETQEILDALDEKFVELEKDRANQPLLNEIFRSVHTIKGAAGFLGFNQIVELTHATENVLKKLRDGIMDATPEIMDVVLQAVDMLKKLLEYVKAQDDRREDLSEIISTLKAIDSGDLLLKNAEKETIKEEITADNTSVCEIPEEVLTNDENDKPSINNQNDKGKISEPEIQNRESNPKETIHVEQTIRVDVERLDSVLNLVGELVLGRNRLMKITSNLESKYTDDPEVSSLSETMAFLNLITSDLQIAVMKTRMQPVRKVFNKFPRMVRDLARSCNKDVELLISGEDTEVDKSVIENIADPLVHLIRNAIDHGIEPRNERIEKGKPEKGLIKLSASQEGNNIVIEIDDDGRGINVDAVKRKALEKRLVTEEQLQNVSDKDALEYIFLPGFSTAQQVSDISGRGVGMDVVKTNLAKLNGSIDIITEEGRGTRFTIKLPLTLAIIQTLMVEVQGETYAIPLGSVLETVKIGQDEIKTIDTQEVIQLRGEIVPILRLARLFNIYSEDNKDRYYAVVVSAEDKKFGIVVDRLKGQEEVVIKAVEGELINFRDSNIIAGATITGEGRVVLIIDVAMMLQFVTRSEVAYV
jgi:two-component system chemotaxis sensor kinase CheA